MADIYDKSIDELSSASSIANADLFVLQQNGVAKSVSGNVVNSFIATKVTENLPGAIQNLGSDFVIEQGTGGAYGAAADYTLESGAWRYRKWNSGIMEAWTTAQFTNVVPDITWANGVYKKLPCAPLTFPVAFSTAPVVTVTANVYGAWGWPIADTSRSYTRPGDIYIFCPATPSTALTVYLNFYAIGRWKN